MRQWEEVQVGLTHKDLVLSLLLLLGNGRGERDSSLSHIECVLEQKLNLKSQNPLLT